MAFASWAATTTTSLKLKPPERRQLPANMFRKFYAPTTSVSDERYLYLHFVANEVFFVVVLERNT